MTMTMFAVFTCVMGRLFCGHGSAPQRQTNAQVRDRHDAQWDEVDGTKQEDLIGSLLLVGPSRLARRQQVTVNVRW